MSRYKSIDQQLLRDVEASGVPAFILAAKSGFSGTVLSLAKRQGRPFSKKHRAHLATTLAKFKAVEAKYPGVKLDFTDEEFVNREFAKLEGGHLQVIPQVNGSAFIREFCKLAGLLPEEFAACAQLAPHIINAPIVSGDGQEWIRLLASEKEYVLEHKPFADFIAKHGGDRRKALTILANESFARLLADVGREKVLSLMAALLRNRELKAASAAATGKN